jgi:hypothetical protein
VARLVARAPDKTPQPMPGRCRGMLIVNADDDAHLKDWAESMGE